MVMVIFDAQRLSGSSVRLGTFFGKSPWRPVVFPVTEEILVWIDTFPDCAGRNKVPNKPEGTSFGYLTIIPQHEKVCDRFPMSEVFIWSLDSELRNYHHNPQGIFNGTDRKSPP
ncbi:MAG: hypothetical protein Q6L68_13285 [Thermostichus sp. DG02_5_bins_236]